MGPMSKRPQQAPILHHDGKYLHAKGDWRYDPDFLAYIMNNSKLNELKLMLYYCGNADGWSCATTNIIQRTGIPDKQAVSKARLGLAEKGWIQYEEGKTVTVLYDAIFREMKGNKGSEKNDPIETSTSDKSLQGNENYSKQGNENYSKSVVKNTTIIIPPSSNITKINNTPAATAPVAPTHDLAALKAKAKPIYIQNSKVKNHEYTQPYPGENLIEIEGEYYYITSDYYEARVEIV